MSRIRKYWEAFLRKTPPMARRISGGCLAAAVIVVMVHSVVAGRQRREMASLGERYRQARKALSVPAPREHREETLVRVRADLSAVRERLGHVTELAGQMRELSDYIRQSGLSADRLNYGAKRMGSLPLWRYEASFRVSGGYAPLKRLLAKIQRSPRLFCIEKLTFSAGAGEGTGVVMDLTISTYLRGTHPPSPERRGG